METKRRLLIFSLLAATATIQFTTVVGYLFPPSANHTSFIRTSCATTPYPDLCFTSLSGFSNAVQQDPAQLTRVAIGISLSKAKQMANYVSKLSRQADYGSDPKAAVAAVHDCFSVFSDAVDEIRGSLKQQMMRLSGSGESLRFQLSNVQTWMSAALTNEEACTDGFEDVPVGPIKSDVCDRAGKVKEVTSNALALVNSYVNKLFGPHNRILKLDSEEGTMA